MAALRSLRTIEILERDGQDAATAYLLQPVAAYYTFQAQDEHEPPDKATMRTIEQACDRYPALKQRLHWKQYRRQPSTSDLGGAFGSSQ